MQSPPGQNPYAPPRAQGQWGAPQQAYDREEVIQRIKHMNNMSFVWGLPGLGLQGIGNSVIGGTAGALIGLVGLALLIVGLTYYARSRGRHSGFAALGLLSCVGIIILALLPKKCLVCGGPGKGRQCTQCGAPVAA